MAGIKVGDRVRIKDRPDWPSPPGYRLANSEGRVIEVDEGSEENVEGFIKIQLEKTEADFDIGTRLTLQTEVVQKI